ncbi:MAG: hypothetical protein CEE38_10710 [Planctomycetes bacterium B3_Pla]|nr:MAG: hypothetical protein CEE38_10710 [Planctomycetes bacterium B3_Pla]
MKIIVSILAIAILMFGGCRSPQESSARIDYDFSTLDKVAIVAVEGAVTSEAAKDQIADFFAIELLEQGYAPVGRSQVRAQLAGQESESKDLTTTEAAVEVGLILDVPAVLAIKIPHFGEEIAITAKMINVEDGSTLWLASGSGKGKRTLSRMFGLGGGGNDQLMGNVMGGPMGAPPAQPLSPDEADKAQRIIKRMCRSLPTKTTPVW